MASIYFPLVLPIPVVASIDQCAKSEGLARSAYVVGLLKDALGRDGALPPLHQGVLDVGPVARGTRSRTVSLLVSAELKCQLATTARSLFTTQAAVCRAIIMRKIGGSGTLGMKKQVPRVVTVTVPALDTSVPESVDHAVKDICRQLHIYGCPARDPFPSADAKAQHLNKVELLCRLTSALFGHQVRLTGTDIAELITLLGPEQAACIAALLGIENTMEVLAVAARTPVQSPSGSRRPASPTLEAP